ncbi:TOBE domain-containing protein, partial [Cypionkella sp.]|uniref:TOBE domain-containing protein n=1 Tax=Cypionkella sp. TaxID=2811411 RepID=UPI00260D7DF4
IFVYATTEPEEALLLGGNTATLWQGHVTQFGPTPQVYRHPVDATTARVFSDPPMNFLSFTKQGNSLRFGGRHADAFNTLPDGAYTAGFRANHLNLHKPSADAIELPCTTTASEITGSETFLHLQHGPDRWVALVHGVQALRAGDEVSLWLDPAHIYVFDGDGRLASAASYAVAA